MDAQIVTNRPAAADATGVRGPHLDMPDKLISGLVYLRSSEDDSEGGDLELYVPGAPRTRLRLRSLQPAPSRRCGWRAATRARTTSSSFPSTRPAPCTA